MKQKIPAAGDEPQTRVPHERFHASSVPKYTGPDIIGKAITHDEEQAFRQKENRARLGKPYRVSDAIREAEEESYQKMLPKA
jgi:hypothetical protein